jgi:tetratricopeptide (TPR) repeat protein
MSRKATLLLLLFSASGAFAQTITPPAELFRDPKFVREFVGSYGFLSDVEPKVSADEQTLLGKVSELFAASKFVDAEKEIQLFIQETEKPTDKKKVAAEISPAMVFVLGNLYFQADRADDARRSFLEAIRRFPRFRRAHTNLGYLYISKNQTNEALPMLQKAIELGESSSRVYGLLGYCHLLKQNPLAAENAYRQAYLLDPNSRDWKLGLAQALNAQERFEESASLLGTLIEENPNDKQLWLQQTNAYLALDRKKDAAINLEILRLKGIADEANLNLLGNLYMEQSQSQLALQAYLAAIEKATVFDVNRALKSARILSDYGFPDRASEFLTKIRPKMGTNPLKADQVALLLTEVRVAQARNETARVGECLAKLQELEPANGTILLEVARHLDLKAREETDESNRSKFIQEAKTHYQLALKTEAVSYAANLALGQMLVRERRYTEALPSLQNALGLKKSESLEQYVSRVRRASDRQEEKEKNKS